jgi:hypothetical protein
MARGESRLRGGPRVLPLAPEGGRRVVTLPVDFMRHGTVAIDVTADGVPSSPRCNTGPLRRSPLRTLGVRVR